MRILEEGLGINKSKEEVIYRTERRDKESNANSLLLSSGGTDGNHRPLDRRSNGGQGIQEEKEMSAKFNDIKVFLKERKNMLGYGSCVINGVVSVDFTIVNGSRGAFASLPSRSYKDENGDTKYRNVVRITDDNDYNAFQKAVIDEFKSQSGQGKAGETDQTPADDSIPF